MRHNKLVETKRKGLRKKGLGKFREVEISLPLHPQLSV
jgi:hypothetical protein